MCIIPWLMKKGSRYSGDIGLLPDYTHVRGPQIDHNSRDEKAGNCTLFENGTLIMHGNIVSFTSTNMGVVFLGLIFLVTSSLRLRLLLVFLIITHS